MTIAKHLGLIALLMALTGPVAAQDAASEAPAEPAAEAGSEEAAAATETEGTVVGDAAVPGGPAEGDIYIAETFGDWTFSCLRTDTGNDPCRFTQTISNNEGGRIAQVSVVPLPAGEAVAAAAIIETPLGTLLRVPRSAEEGNQPGGLRMRVDDGQTRLFQFTYCVEAGCVAEIGMEEDLVSDFRRGGVATLTIWSAEAPDRPVEMSLSLIGFTAGYERVAGLAQLPPAEE